MRDVKREAIPTDQTCDKCDKPMVLKWGRFGQFLACSGYPDCKNTRDVAANGDVDQRGPLPDARGGQDRRRSSAEPNPIEAEADPCEKLRQADDPSPGPIRSVPGLLGLPRLQDHPQGHR